MTLDVEKTQEAIADAHQAAGSRLWPPGYSGQIIGEAGSERVRYAWQVNGDLDPFKNPEQIGRLPPDDRLSDTPEACVAAAWADHYARTGERPLHAFEIGPDTYAAYDVADAWAVLKEQTGLEQGDDDVEDDEPTQVPDHKTITIRLEPEDRKPGDPPVLTLTAAEWCARDGRGLICSTEY